MHDCPRCWVETNTDDVMMVPDSGRPYLESARTANCLELAPDEAVPEHLWSRLAGEFEMVERWGDDERPYLESEGVDWFTIWAFGSVANLGLGSHVRNVLGPGGSSLTFHLWFP